jgi:hypothetical protein
MKYIFSLTTIPSKFDNLYLTLNSLICQTIKPHKIILNLPKKYSFRFNDSIIDGDKIEKLYNTYKDDNLVINILDNDMGPGTKLLGLFFNEIIDIDELDYIVLVDDDLVYKQDMVENFKNFIQDKTVYVASYHTYCYKNIVIGQGADGFFLKPETLSKILHYYNTIKSCRALMVHDDFYFSFYFKEHGYEIINVDYHDKPCYKKHEFSDIDSLTFIQGIYKRKIKLCYDVMMKYKSNNYYETSE